MVMLQIMVTYTLAIEKKRVEGLIPGTNGGLEGPNNKHPTRPGVCASKPLDLFGAIQRTNHSSKHRAPAERSSFRRFWARSESAGN
jgi:hypothetical protein